MKRAKWSSKVGFIFAAAGSAVGLANIWRFPYIVGSSGGAAFIALYLLCLALVGFPAFIAEVLIGRTTQLSPSGAFRQLGGNQVWAIIGKLIILTGFLVSSFYSAVAGWILGYFIEALWGAASSLPTTELAKNFHTSLMSNWLWGLGYHTLFMFLCGFVLFSGVRKGIERGSKFIMPVLYMVLIILVVTGLSLPNSFEGLVFLFKPDWHEVTPLVLLIALGQAFFTLSIGQGTMITYGSYLSEEENLLSSCLPVALMDTIVSILSAIAVFTIVFSAGLEPDAGEGLLFQTLPIVFSKIPGGYFVGVLFFLLVFLAAVTSQISAMEPTIAFLIDRFQFSRKKAVISCALGAYIIGVPCALSTNALSNVTLFGMNPLELMIFVTLSILIPLGGFLAVILVGWRWGVKNAVPSLKLNIQQTFIKHPRFGVILERFINSYFWICFKYISPILIAFVFLNALGILR